ncbi:MAG: 30S ribosomal protein S18 [Planctomycetota bacterium]|nr:30S ribosomal protein S18 [Planctomycetota bacterium]
MAGRPRRGGRGDRKFAPVKPQKLDKPADYKDTEFLIKHLGPQGQIKSRARTGYGAQDQKSLKKAIKRARHLGLLPFVG